MGRGHQKRILTALALATMALRVLVPAGLMPSALAENGWYLSICPDGLPAHVAHALFGHAHHTDGAADYVQCDLGAGLGHAFAPAPDTELIVADITTAPIATRVFEQRRATPFTSYASRAPPTA